MDILLLLGILACPLGMLAMGGLAWLVGKSAGRQSKSLERVGESHAQRDHDARRRAAAVNRARGVGSRG